MIPILSSNLILCRRKNATFMDYHYLGRRNEHISRIQDPRSHDHLLQIQGPQRNKHLSWIQDPRSNEHIIYLSDMLYQFKKLNLQCKWTWFEGRSKINMKEDLLQTSQNTQVKETSWIQQIHWIATKKEYWLNEILPSSWMIWCTKWRRKQILEMVGATTSTVKRLL